MTQAEARLVYNLLLMWRKGFSSLREFWVMDPRERAAALRMEEQGLLEKVSAPGVTPVYRVSSKIE